MKYSALLERLGFEKRAAEIYLFLLEKGLNSVSVIAKSLGYHRAEIYQSLPLLLEEKIIARVAKGKRFFYRAENPVILQKKFEAFELQYKAAIPKLLDSFRDR